MSYKTEHIVNITEFLALEDAIEEYKFHYIGLSGFNDMIMYEPVNNVIFEIKPIAKWFQKYTDKSVRVDMRASFADISDSAMKQVIYENFDYINNKYVKSRVTIKKDFGEMSKTDIYKAIKNWEIDNTFLAFNNIEKFLKLINILSRKEKVAKLLG